jgi:two-component system sensor histidine kinase AlgZ
VERRVPVRHLPRELFFVYPLAPILVAPLLHPGFFDQPVVGMLMDIGGDAVPFVTIPAGIHVAYRFVMPRLSARVQSLTARLFLHAVATALIAVAVAVPTRPMRLLFFPEMPPMASFLVRSVVVTWTLVLPALLVQELRARADDAQRRLLEQKQAALRAELEALRSRINPHFLFNSMNTVASLIQDDPQLAERTLERLAGLLHYALRGSRLEDVTLGREVEMLRDYLEIQRARFGDRLRYSIEVEPGLEALEVPPVLLQPLVENAVLHGIAGRSEGGHLLFTARRRDGWVELRIDDDGPGPGASAHRGSGTSLDDIKRRLELVYGEAGLLMTRRNALGGFTVEIAVPRAGI